MKHLSILTALAFVASFTVAGVVDTQDPPDIRLLTGASAADVFDLNDYFASNNAGAPSFSGDVAANGSVSVSPAGAPGLTDLSATIAVGGDSGTVSYTRKASSFLLEGGPMVDESLQLVDQAAGTNVFLNCLRPGAAVTSAAPITGAPEGSGTGGGGTPGNGTPSGSASWSITFGQVVSGYTATGLKTRSSSVIASGGASLSNGGLTASIGADGTYTLQADAAFAGPVIVTFIAEGGDNDMDSVSVLASKAVSVGDNYKFNDFNSADTTGVLIDPAGTVTFGAALSAAPEGLSDGTGVKVDAAADQTVLIYLPQVAVSGKVTVSVSAWAYGSGGVLSLAALDSQVFAGQQDLTYMTSSGDEAGVGVPRKLQVTYTAPSGQLIPVLQAQGQVEFDNLEICAAAAPDCYAYGATALDLFGFAAPTAPLAGDLSGGLTGTYGNIAGRPDFIAGTASAANNFDTANAAGSVALACDGINVVSNITVSAEHPGTSAQRVVAFVEKTAAAGLGATYGVVAVVYTGQTAGGMATFGTFAAAPNLSGWTEIEATGQVQNAQLAPALNGVSLITVQAGIAAAGGTAADTFAVNADDIAVYAVDDAPEFFDATLLGS